MPNKFLIIILSLSLLAEDEKSESAVISGQSQVRSQSTFDGKEKRPILYPMLYPKDMTCQDDITGYQRHSGDAAKPSSKDLNASTSIRNLTSAQLQDLTFGQMFDISKFGKLKEFPKLREFSKLTINPDGTNALSIIKNLKEEQIAKEAQPQTSSDINLSVDAVDDLDNAFEPNFTRHKIELDLEIPEQQDFYDELVYLSALGLNLARDTMSSSIKEGKKLFTLVFVDQSTEDKFKNELKYFRKIAKIRASRPDAILPKTYLEVAQKLEGKELQNALNNYYREYECQVKSVLAGAVAKAKELPYHDWIQAIQASINKSKDSLVDYQQLVGDLIKLDYNSTQEITAKLAQIINLLQSENRVIKINLNNLKDYLEKNNFNSELIIVVKKLFSDLENFRKILLTKSRLKPLSQDTDFSADYENIKKFFDAKAVQFYDQKYQ